MGLTVISSSIVNVCIDGICTGCGTCAGVCPTDALTMQLNERKGTYEPKINIEKCTSCSLCRSCCPPLTWSNRPQSDQWHPALGDYVSTAACCSANSDIRRESASGGFITTLLIHLLNSKAITGAIVSRRRHDDAFNCETFLATTEEEILDAKGSKYSPVTFADALSLMRELKPTSHRLAVVGLPCHVEGISRAAQKNRHLMDLIKYKISLVCGQAPSFAAYDYLLRQLGITRADVLKLSNRGDGWPGFISIEKKDNTTWRAPYGSALSMGTVLSSPIFTPDGCQLCADPAGFAADVSVGDAWLKRFSADTQGTNLILVRNKELNHIISGMGASGVIALMESTVDEFIEANRNVMNHKIVNRPVGLTLLLGKKASVYNTGMVNSDQLSSSRRLKLAIFYLHIRLLRNLDISFLGRFVNRPVLFYLKILNLLKK